MWLQGLFFLPRQDKLVLYRPKEWLRVQKGAWGYWRGTHWARVGGLGTKHREEALLPIPTAATAFPPLQKLTVDLGGVRGVLQSQQQKLQQRVQQGEHATGSCRLYDLYWQAMRILGVQ